MVAATLVHYVCAFILKIAPGVSSPPPYRDIKRFSYFYLNKKTEFILPKYYPPLMFQMWRLILVFNTVTGIFLH